jgi:hypothetical protein
MIDRGRRLWRLAAVLLACLAGLSGCGTPGPGGPADTFGLDLSITNPQRQSGAIVFVVDGVNAEIFQQMLEAGQLPAMRKYFVDRGLYVPHAVANIPSVTLPNLTTLASGQFPGHHDVVGVNWFDRNQLVWRDYETIAQKNTLDSDTIAPFIYDRFPGRTTVSVFFQPHRMATKFFENWTSAGPPFYFGWYRFVDRLTLSRLGELADVARARGEWPAVTYVYLLAPDFEGYAHGIDSPQYRQALMHTDRQIGRVLGDLQRAGLLDRLVIALVSDHGLVDVRRHLDLAAYLRKELGIRLAGKRLWETTAFEKRLAYYQEYPAVAYGSGDRYLSLCLRKPVRRDGTVTGYESWLVRPSAGDLRHYPNSRGQEVDLAARLADLPAVRAVAYSAGADTVRLAVRDGEVEFAQPQGRDGPIRYRVIAGDDPLGWHGAIGATAAGGTELSPRAWFDLTASSDWPDVPAQLVAYFRSRRAGDLMVFAGDDWDLGTRLRAGHGGVDPTDMNTPMLLAGPGVPHGTLDYARTADLVPTLLALLGRPPLVTDGQSLVPANSGTDTETPSCTGH